MSEAHEALPPRPVPPRPDECCGSGCPRCVYELYDEALAEWKKIVAARAPQPNPPLQGAPSLASEGRSAGTEHAPSNPGLAPEHGERESSG